MDSPKLIQVLTETLSPASDVMARSREALRPGDERRPFVIHQLSKPVLEVLLQSEPFTPGAGFAIPQGNGLSGYYAQDAAHALVGRVIEGESPKDAVQWLERIIAIERAEGYSAMALWGVAVKAPVDLGHDVVLMPFAALPASPSKAWFTAQRDRPLRGFLPHILSSPPTAAIVRREVVEPVLHRVTDGKFPEPPDRTPDDSLLDDVRLALTLIGPCSPVSAGSWFDFANRDLLSMGLGVTMMGTIQDVLPVGLARPVMLDPEDAKNVVHAFIKHTDPARASLRLALSRFNQAVRRTAHGDRAIDLAIALESLLVDGAGENTYKVGLRAALLLPVPLEERKRVRALISALYAARSSLMHDGRLPSQVKVAGSGKRQSAEVIEEATTVCASILRAILEAGPVQDWYSFELAGGASIPSS
jgi:hypothetical protein